jgi:hypothetical protein
VTKFGFNWPSSFRGEDLWMKSLRRSDDGGTDGRTDAKWWQKLTLATARWAKKSRRGQICQIARMLKFIYPTQRSFAEGIMFLTSHHFASVRPSVPPSSDRRKLFIQRSSPLKLLGQLKPNLVTMILGWPPFKIVSGRTGSNPRFRRRSLNEKFTTVGRRWDGRTDGRKVMAEGIMFLTSPRVRR